MVHANFIFLTVYGFILLEYSVLMIK